MYFSRRVSMNTKELSPICRQMGESSLVFMETLLEKYISSTNKYIGSGGESQFDSLFFFIFTCDKGFAFAATRSASLSMCV